MKIVLLLISLAAAGCQAPQAPATPHSPPPLPAAATRSTLRSPEKSALERRQAQLIEALISQNDALQHRLAAAPSVVARTDAASPLPTTPDATRDLPKPESLACIEPDQEGVVDLTMREAGPGEPVNPFAVRNAVSGKHQELSLVVSGIVAGHEKCAVINDRLVQPGDTVGALKIDGIETGAVYLGYGDHRIRLTVSETPVRVRLPN
jgi:hypothetical protein